jgi:histidine triad (HIT) family protein
MASIFTKIIQGELPCHKLYEDENHLAFLDVRPIRAGHSLVIPKREVDYIFNLEDEELASLMSVAKKVASAIEQEIPCKRIGMTVIGIEVPHTHIHLLPIDGVADIDFSLAKPANSETLAELALKISSHL